MVSVGMVVMAGSPRGSGGGEPLTMAAGVIVTIGTDDETGAEVMLLPGLIKNNVVHNILWLIKLCWLKNTVDYTFRYEKGYISKNIQMKIFSY